MRYAFSEELTDLARNDDRIILLTGDIGNQIFNPFCDLFPDRFYNCGIAEANMISVAAGLAMSGFRPFVYAQSSFVVGRSYDQIRIDISFQNVPVVILGLGGGLTYSCLGPTHTINIDLAILRVLPNMTIICPADPIETRAAIRDSLKINSPTYIRIGRENESIINKSTIDFNIGSGIKIKEGNDICLITNGSILADIIQSVENLTKIGINPGIINLHTIKPIDHRLLKNIFNNYPIVISIEEHSCIGGLGSAISDWINTELPQNKSIFLSIGIPDKYSSSDISKAELLNDISLSSEKIEERITSIYNKYILYKTL